MFTAKIESKDLATRADEQLASPTALTGFDADEYRKSVRTLSDKEPIQGTEASASRSGQQRRRVCALQLKR
jgi:hypothetical protein